MHYVLFTFSHESSSFHYPISSAFNTSEQQYRAQHLLHHLEISSVTSESGEPNRLQNGPFKCANNTLDLPDCPVELFPWVGHFGH